MEHGLLLRITALLGATAVGLGAFGAHGLRDLLASNGTTAIWEKAVFYHFVHVLSMLALCLLAKGSRLGPWICFLAGIAIFSGSLYVMAITNLRWLGAVTPIGGFSFITGWLWLAIRPPAAPQPSSATPSR